MLWRLLVEILVALVLGGIEPLAGLLVDPVVADHAVLVRMRAREQRRMSYAGVRGRMTVVVVAVPSAAVEQEPEAALAILVVVFDELFLREAVNHHEQDELGRRLAAGSRSGLCWAHARPQTERGYERGQQQPTDGGHGTLPHQLSYLTSLMQVGC